MDYKFEKVCDHVPGVNINTTAAAELLDSGSQSLTIHGVRGIRRRVRA
jgi:hypothetical protein